jgi:transcriptional regulator with XRE-family HTH domain
VLKGNAVSFPPSLGHVVKAWREARGLTITQLASHAGAPMTKGYLSQLEHDRIRLPRDENLARLSAALEIPVVYLLTRRLPDKASRAEASTEMGQPLTPAERLREEELLQRMLSLVEELRTVISELLEERGRKQGQ